jgi:hypothetical protein
MTNSSLFTADRTTHLKIVVVSLLASIAVMVVGIAARPQLTVDPQQANVYKPAKAILATSNVLSEVNANPTVSLRSRTKKIYPYYQ